MHFGSDKARGRGTALSLAMLAVLVCSLGLAQWVSVARQPPRPPELQTQTVGSLQVDLPRRWRTVDLGDPALDRVLRDARLLAAADDDESRLLVARLPDGPPRPPHEAMQQAMSLLFDPSRVRLPLERSPVRRVRVGPAVGAVCEALTDERRKKHFLAVISLDGRRHHLIYLTGPVHGDHQQMRQAVMELSRDRIFFDAMLGSIRLRRWRTIAVNAGTDALFPLPDAGHPWQAHVDDHSDGRTWLWAPAADDGIFRMVRSRWVMDTTSLDPAQHLAPPQLLAERYWLTHERPPTARELGEARFGSAAIWQVNLTGDPRQLPILARHVWLAAIAPGRLMLLEIVGEPAGMRDAVFFARDLITATASVQPAADSAAPAAASSTTVEEALVRGHQIRDHQSRVLAAGPPTEEDCHLIERDGELVGWEIGRLWRQRDPAERGVQLTGRSAGMFGPTLRIRSRAHADADATLYEHTRVMEHLNDQGQILRAVAQRLTLDEGMLRFAVAHDGGPARLQWEMSAPQPLLSPLGADDWPLHLLDAETADTPAPAAIVWLRWGGSRPTPFEVRLAEGPQPAEGAADAGVKLWIRPLFGLDTFTLALDQGGRAVRYESLWEGSGAAGSQWHTTRRVSLEQLRASLPDARQAIDQALRELEREHDTRF